MSDTLVDPKVFELAGDFLDDVCTAEPIASRPLPEDRYDALQQRLAQAMQRAIEDECTAIRQELEAPPTQAEFYPPSRYGSKL